MRFKISKKFAEFLSSGTVEWRIITWDISKFPDYEGYINEDRKLMQWVNDNQEMLETLRNPEVNYKGFSPFN